MLVHVVNQPLGPGSSVGAAVTLESSYLQSLRSVDGLPQTELAMTSEGKRIIPCCQKPRVPFETGKGRSISWPRNADTETQSIIDQSPVSTCKFPKIDDSVPFDIPQSEIDIDKFLATWFHKIARNLSKSISR